MENKIIAHTPGKRVFSQPELPIHIFSYLDLYDLMACMLVSKGFLQSAKQDELWHGQFRVHFPDIFKKFSDDALSIAGWYWKFQQTYKNEYIGKVPSEPLLDKQLRKCTTWEKEGNQEALKKELRSINFAEFMFNLALFVGGVWWACAYFGVSL